MRLTTEERNQIKKQVIRVFGEDSRVWLFGSRMDDTKKGGDIDLYIEPKYLTHELKQKISLLTQLQLTLGDQKIDIVIAKDPSRLIEKEAREGVLL